MIRLKQLLFEDNEQDDFMKRVVKQVYDRYVIVIKKHDPKSIVTRFPERLSPASSYVDFFKHFKDKRTGYDSFTAMVKGEFDAVRDKALLDQLSGLLTKSGITNERVPNGHIKIIRIDSGTADAVSSHVPDGLKEKYNALLPKAVKWWKDWLNDPITKQKIIKNINATKKPNEAPFTEKWLNDTLYVVYFKVLNSIELRFVDPSKPDSKYKFTPKPTTASALAYVRPDIAPTTLFINYLKQDDEPIDTLIHEIQHLLYNKYPFNPSSQVLKIFNNKSNTPNTSNSSIDANLQSISKKYQVETKDLEWWKQTQDNYEKKNPGYTSSPNEKLSNIVAVRRLFNLKPGQPITVAMIKPYITGTKSHTDVYWLLMGWASAKFPDLQQFLNEINDLAQQNVNKTNSIEPNNQNIT